MFNDPTYPLQMRIEAHMDMCTYACMCTRNFQRFYGNTYCLASLLFALLHPTSSLLPG